ACAGQGGLVGRAGDARTSCPGGEVSRRGKVVAAGLDRVGEVECKVTAYRRYHLIEFSRSPSGDNDGMPTGMRRTLALLCAAQFVVVLDVTIVAVALPA